MKKRWKRWAPAVLLVLLVLLLLKPLVFLLLLVVDLFLLLLLSLVLLWIAGIGRSRALVRRNIIRVDWRRRPRSIVLGPRSIVFGARRIVFGARRIVLRPGPRVGIGTTSVSRLCSGRVGIAMRSPTIRRWIVRRASFSCRNRRLESCWPRCRRHWRAPTIDRRSQVWVRACRLHLLRLRSHRRLVTIHEGLSRLIAQYEVVPPFPPL